MTFSPYIYEEDDLEMRGNLLLNQHVDPVARARALGVQHKQLTAEGIAQPVEAIELELPRYEKEQRDAQIAAVDPITSPVAHKALRDPIKGPVYAPDAPVAEKTEGWFQNMATRAQLGQAQLERSTLMSPMIRQAATPEQAERLRLLDSEIAVLEQRKLQSTGLGGVADFLQDTPHVWAEQLPLWIASASRAWDEMGAGMITGAGVGTAFGGAGAIPGAIAGGAVGFLSGTITEMAKLEAGNVKQELVGIRDDNGRPLDPALVDGMAIVAGLVMGGIETLDTLVGGKIAGSIARPLLKSGMRAGIRQLLNSPKRRLIAQTGRLISAGAGLNAVEEGLQESVQLLTRQIGLSIAGQPLDSPEQIGKQIGQAAGMGAKGGMISTPVQILAAANVTQQTEKLLTRNAAEAQSLAGLDLPNKLLATMPDERKAFINGVVAQHGASSHVGMPVGALTAFMQASNTSMADLNAMSPETADSYQQALKSGADVQMPIADFVEHFLPAEGFAQTLPDVRMHPETLTDRERASAMETLKMAAEAGQLVTPVDAKLAVDIAAEVRKVQKVGAAEIGQLHASFLTTMAERYGQGLTARDLYEGKRLTFAREETEVAENAAAITELRAGDVVTDTQVYGESLQELVEREGDTPETRAKAIKAGYFMSDDPAQVTDLEVQTRLDPTEPSYAPGNIDLDAQRRKEAQIRVQADAEYLGVDLEKGTPEEASTVLLNRRIEASLGDQAPVDSIPIVRGGEATRTQFQIDDPKWPIDQTNVAFSIVNNRLSKELKVIEHLFGPIEAAETMPGAGKQPMRSIRARDLGMVLHRAAADGTLAKLLDKSIPIEKLADERGLTGKARKDFTTEVVSLRDGPKYFENDEKGQPILSGNGKVGASVDLLLGTCQPTTPCKECYAASTMIRMSSVRKALRTTAQLLVDPEKFGREVAAEVAKVKKTELPFIRLLGSGDMTSTETVAAFNSLAKHADRPIQIFSRHHENLGKLHGTKRAPFIKMGSIDADLFRYYGMQYLKDNMKERGVNNAFLYTNPRERVALVELFENDAIGLVLSASHELHETLPPGLQQRSCPCDAGERSYLGSCRQCALSTGGCFTAFANKAVDDQGGVWDLSDPDMPKKVKPVLGFMEGVTLTKAQKKAGATELSATWSRIAADVIRQSISLAMLYRGNYVKQEEKAAKGGADKVNAVTLKDIRFPGDTVRFADAESYERVHGKPAPTAPVDTRHGTTIYLPSKMVLEQVDAFLANQRWQLAQADKHGTFYLPGGPVQKPVAYKRHERMGSPEVISTEDAQGLLFQTDQEIQTTNLSRTSGNTAISRKSSPVPVAWLILAGLVRGEVFHQGPGRDTFSAQAMMDAGATSVAEHDPNHAPNPAALEGQYDTVVSPYVLNTLPLQYRADAIMDIANTLKEGGVAYIALRDVASVEGAKSKVPHEDGWRVRKNGEWNFQKGYNEESVTADLSPFFESVRVLKGKDRAGLKGSDLLVEVKGPRPAAARRSAARRMAGRGALLGSTTLYQTDIGTPAHLWYSQMEQHLAKSLPKTGTGESFAKLLRGWAGKSYKAEELEWSGLAEEMDDWGGAKVTRDQALAYLHVNNLDVGEVLVEAVGPTEANDLTSSEARGLLLEYGFINEEEALEMDSDAIIAKLQDNLDAGYINQDALWEHSGNIEDDTQYADYSAFATFKNAQYKELVLTANSEQAKIIEAEDDVGSFMDFLMGMARSFDMDPESVSLLGELNVEVADEIRAKITERQAEKAEEFGAGSSMSQHWGIVGDQMDIMREKYVRAEALTKAGYQNRKAWYSPHWGTITDPIGHVRFFVTTYNGQRTLVLDEVQGDFQQAAGKMGSRGVSEKTHEAAMDKLKQLQADKADLEATIRAMWATRYLHKMGAGDPTTTAKPLEQYSGRDQARAFYALEMMLKDNVVTHENVIATIVDEDPVAQPVYDAYMDMATEEALLGDDVKSMIPAPPWAKSWPLKIMQRMVRYAAENGFERIMWSSSVQQHERWGTEEFIWHTADDGTVRLFGEEQVGGTAFATDDVQQRLNEQQYRHQATVESLSDVRLVIERVQRRKREEYSERNWEAYLDKEAAKIWDRIAAGEKEGQRTPRASGMEGFYDKRLRNDIQNFFKKAAWGKAKVGLEKVALNESGQLFIERMPLPPTHPNPPWLLKVSRGKGDSAVLATFATKEEAQTALKEGSSPWWSMDINEKMREKATGEGFTLFQPMAMDTGGARRPKGYIEISPLRDYFKITLTGKADLSTMLHESGHYFLEVFSNLANSKQAPADMKKDWATILDYVGASPGAVELTRAQHELWARGFEQYLRDGNAPTPGLISAFRRFASWLKHIYRTSAALRAPLTPEVRDVMDRMLASDDQIKAMKEISGLAPLFTSAEQAGLTAVEYATHRKNFAEAMEDSEEKMRTRVLGDLTRAQRKEYRDLKAALTVQVGAQVAARPVYAALGYLTTGKVATGEPPPELGKLDRDAVKALFYNDPKILTKMPRGITVKNGADPDIVARYFGFGTAHEMLTAFTEAKPAKQAIKEEVQDGLDAAFGNMMDNQSDMNRAAMSALHNDKHEEFAVKELRLLSRRANRPLPPGFVREAQLLADAQVGAMSVGQLSSANQFMMAEQREYKKVIEAMARNAWDEAVDHQKKRLINHWLYRKALAAKKKIDTNLKYLRNFEQPKTQKRLGKAGGRYLEAINTLLADVQLTRLPKTAIARRRSLESYLKQMEADGQIVSVPEDLRAEAGMRHYSEMTFTEFGALRDAVQNIDALARLKGKLLYGKKVRDAARLDQMLATSIRKSKKVAKQADPFNIKFWDRQRDKIRSMDADLLKAEFLFRRMDSDQVGPVHEHVFLPLAEAQKAYYDKLKALEKSLLIPVRKLTRARKARYARRYNFMGKNLAGHQIIAIALNVGNDGNLMKITKGYSWSEETLLDQLDAWMTAEDWQLVSHIWKEVDQYWPEIEALQKKYDGVGPPKIEPRQIQTRHGVIEGGYYPVIYDPNQRRKSYEDQQKIGSDMFENNFMRPAVSKGFTQTRTQYFAPIELNLHALGSHLNEVIHYLTHYEAIRNADIITRGPEFEEAVIERMGKEYYRLIRPWLQSIANSTKRSDEQTYIERVADHLTTGVSITAMGFSLSTGLMQLLGIATTASKVGVIDLVAGIGSIVKPGNRRFAYDNSNELAHVTSTFDRDARRYSDQFLTQLTGKSTPKQIHAKITKLAFATIGYVQREVSMATWFAAYKQATKAGKDPKAAATHADHIMRITQSGGAAKDLASVQRGAGTRRLFTAFYTYFSALYGNEREMMVAMSEGRIIKMSRDLAALIIIPVIVEQLARQGWPDEEEERDRLATQLLLYPFASVPILRDALNVASGYGYRFAPVGDILERGLAAGYAVVADDANLTESKKRALWRAGGMVLHLPATGVERPARWLIRYLDGDLEEPTREFIFGVKR